MGQSTEESEAVREAGGLVDYLRGVRSSMERIAGDKLYAPELDRATRVAVETREALAAAAEAELRALRLELAAQQEEGRALREQVAELQRADEARSAREDERASLLNRCIASAAEWKRRAMQLQIIPAFPEWDAEIDRANATSIIPECAPDCLTRQPPSRGKLGAICTCGAVRA